MENGLNKQLLSRRLFFAAAALVFTEAVFAVLFIYKLYSLAPTKYFVPICIASIALIIGHYLALAFSDSHHLHTGIASLMLSTVLICVFSYGLGVLVDFFSSLESIQSRQVETQSMQLYVLKSSSITDKSANVGLSIGVRGDIDIELTESAISELQQRSDIRSVTRYANFDDMVEALLREDVDGILVKDSYMALIEDNFKGLGLAIRPVFAFEMQPASQQKSEASSKDLTQNPFTVYLSGVDESGSLSDVNILLTVNPVTHVALITNVPRDYYVYLDGDENRLDKLTHAGTYGVDCSIGTIEKLIGIDIDYYVKINFQSVVNIVDAVGGIDVYSDRAFTSEWALDRSVTYQYAKGMNHLDGKMALAFARERKSFATGDRMRTQHQEAVIQAVIEKLRSPSVIGNVSAILSAVTANTMTDISSDQILSLIRMQLADSPDWQLHTLRLDGTDATRRCYSTRYSAFVIIPDEDMVLEAKDRIEAVYNGTSVDNEATDVFSVDTERRE